jgi:predicted pyridoxine 5'-phosphate oxidase superfamily flavin-nucleotide-binding protein
MTKLPKTILNEWLNKSGASIITTVSPEGITNSIYATCVSLYNNEKILIANNLFNKTLNNIKNGCKGNFLFLTKENKSYQLKGDFTYFTEGELFDDMNKWNSKNHTGLGVAVLEVNEIYSGSKKITS